MHTLDPSQRMTTQHPRNPHIGKNGVLFPNAKESYRRFKDTRVFTERIMQDGYFELRAIARGRMRPRRALFDDAEQLAIRARIWNQQGYDVYMTVNPAKEVDGSLRDDDIDRIEWFLIDLDPERGSGKQKDAASVQERLAALDELKAVRLYLDSEEWGEPNIVFESGNGYWAMYTLKQENSARAARLRHNALEGLRERFPMVDPTVYNASRIVRIPGTMNWKAMRPAELIHIDSDRFGEWH